MRILRALLVAAAGAVAIAGVAAAAVAWRRRHEDPPPPAMTPKTATARARGCELVAELVPDRASAPYGVRRSVTFRVTAPSCAQRLQVLVVPDASNSLGRPESFQVSALDAHGDPAASVEVKQGEGSGADGLAPFGRDAPYEQTLELAQWVKLAAPGRYLVTVTRSLLVGTSREDVDEVRFEVATPIEVAPP